MWRSYLSGMILAMLWVGDGRGQTVQLPSQRRISVHTSVAVPDRGGAVLGGVTRSAFGTSWTGVPGLGRLPGARALLGNRALGGESSAAGVSVHVSVTDFDALDRAVRAAARRHTDRAAGESRQASRLQGAASDRSPFYSDSGQFMSVEEIRQLQLQRQCTQHSEARQWFTQGKLAAAAGHPGAAKIYFQMAYRRADPPLKQAITAYLKSSAAPAAGPDQPPPGEKHSGSTSKR